MIRCIILLVAAIVSVQAWAQSNYGQEEALIRLKNGDSIQCFLRIELNYGPKIWYKKDATADYVSIKSSEVKSMTTPTKYLENITVGKNEMMMTRMSTGKAELFLHVTLQDGGSQPLSGGTTQLYGPPTLLYVICKDFNCVQLKRKDYREKLAAMMPECPTVVRKLMMKVYDFAELQVAVDEYNGCR